MITRKKNNLAPFKLGRAWIELDMESLRYNVNLLRGILPESCELMPAVKANAYGHGAVLICRELNKLGVRNFCVASVTEGAELRRGRIRGDILVLGYTHPKQFHLLKQYHLTQTIIDHNYATVLNGYGKKLEVHIKVDTGMHRLGERSENIDKILQIYNYNNLAVSGIYTHLCAADLEGDEGKAFTQAQIDKFNAVLSGITEKGYPRPKAHIHGSYGVFLNNTNMYDYARVGIALYGMLSGQGDAETRNAALRPVLSIKARICAVKTVFANEPAGYGLAFTAVRDTPIAILAIGYADGIPRDLSGGAGYALINGCEAPVVGRVCMDLMAVDITGIENVYSGDIAVIIGKSGAKEITACDMAKQAGTISNEILSRLSVRLERVVILSVAN
jgi:serine/alanine racemase